METLREAIRSLILDPPVSYRNLTVFPLVGKTPGGRRYRTLDEALEAGTARVTEVGAGGSVPELMLVNEGAEPVLLVDGEELKGAKQNRVLNLTLLVAGGKSLVIPVSCVEAGRWGGSSLAFESSANVLYSTARASKVAQVSGSMSRGRGYFSDQGALWDHIAGKHERLGTASRTRAMDDAYRQRSGDVEGYVRSLRASPTQVGAVFALDGRVAGCEVFDHPETLAGMLAKLVRSYALDAIETAEAACVVPPPEAARAFLDEVSGASMESSRALGMGEDVRISAPRLVGAALCEDGRLVHLSAFRLAEGWERGEGDGSGTRLASYLMRRGMSRNRRGPGSTGAA